MTALIFSNDFFLGYSTSSNHKLRNQPNSTIEGAAFNF